MAGVATITEAGGLVTLKDPKTGIAIQFRKGETLQRYTHEIQAPARFLRSGTGLDYLGIVAAELVEQALLRKEYIADWRAGVESQLENTYIMDAQGNKRKLEKKK